MLWVEITYTPGGVGGGGEEKQKAWRKEVFTFNMNEFSVSLLPFVSATDF